MSTAILSSAKEKEGDSERCFAEKIRVVSDKEEGGGAGQWRKSQRWLAGGKAVPSFLYDWPGKTRDGRLLLKRG